MTNAASDLAKASLAGFPAANARAVAEHKGVAPRDPNEAAMLPHAPQQGRYAPDPVAGPQQGGRSVLIGVPASAPRQNPPEVVLPPPTPPVAIPLRVAISPVAADGETSGANLAMRCALLPARALSALPSVLWHAPLVRSLRLMLSATRAFPCHACV